MTTTNSRTKNSANATMTVTTDIGGVFDAEGNEIGTRALGTATVGWGVRRAGSWNRYSKRFESREAANNFANKKWAEIK